jgi:hypothetical protein
MSETAQDNIRPLAWLPEALAVAWHNKWFLLACGAAFAVLEALLGRLWGPSGASTEAWADALRLTVELAIAGALGTYAYRAILLRENPSANTSGWCALPLAMLRAVIIECMAAALIAAFVLALVGLIAGSSAGLLAALSGKMDPMALFSVSLFAPGLIAIPVFALFMLVGLPLWLLLEIAVVVALGDVATTTGSGWTCFFLALRRMWRHKYRLVLPSYVIVALAFAAGAVVPSVTWMDGAYVQKLLAIAGFAWWSGFIVVVNRALATQASPTP